MAERADLEAAADAGVIQREQVEPLVVFLASRAVSPAPRQRGLGATVSGEEELRFIRNFHDVFLAMGIAILAIGFGVGIATLMGQSGGQTGETGFWTLLIGSVFSAAALWGLGEIFSRRRRLFLPSIAICVAFVTYAAIAATCVYGLISGAATMFVGSDGGVRVEGDESLFWIPFMAFSGGAALAALGFYLRFRLPFAVGLTGIAAAGFVATLFHAISPVMALQAQPALSLLLGAALFAAAVMYDARDPSRGTRYSDNGFWLHFAAAPLILGGVLAIVSQVFGGEGRSWMDVNTGETAPPDSSAVPRALATLLVVAALGFVSLLINRRALIVSALLTTGVAIGVLMNATGLGEGALIAATLVTLGGFVLVLGAGWHGARRVLLKQVKPDGVWARVFPPEADDEGHREIARA